MVNNITELLEKFDKINFDNYESKEFTKDDWSLHYNLTMSEMLGVQVILNLFYRRRIVKTWGCVDEDNLAAVKWIKRTQRRIEEDYWKLEENAEELGKELFEKL